MAGGAAATRRRRSEHGIDVLKLQGQQIRRIYAMLDALLEVAPAGIANAMRSKLNGSQKEHKEAGSRAIEIARFQCVIDRVSWQGEIQRYQREGWTESICVICE